MQNNLVMSHACEPYNPHQCPDFEWEVSINGHFVRCRKVWIDNDVPAICQWLDAQQGAKFSLGLSLNQHLTHLAQSDYAQPYLVLDGAQPIIQVEIVASKYSEISIYTDVLPTDYCLYAHFCQDPTLFDLQVDALYRMLDWLQAEGIWRVWSAISGDATYDIPLFHRAGFEFIKTLSDRYETALFYFEGHQM